MASKPLSMPNLQQQPKATSYEPVEYTSRRPSPSQLSKVNKSDPATPRSSSISANQQKAMSTDTELFTVQILSHDQKEFDNNAPKTDNDSNLPKVSSESSKQGDVVELPRVDGTTSLESNGDQEKKNFEQSSAKDSASSPKVSDGTNNPRKTSGSAKISGRTDIAESGKSSMCRPSSSSDFSDESSCSSSVSKPHKANDSRWEAIQILRSRDGVLGLNHFRLLKKLGCGDIGSVYLPELSGMKCYFVMKVMDKGSLASCKKLVRAQTEKRYCNAWITRFFRHCIRTLRPKNSRVW